MISEDESQKLIKAMLQAVDNHSLERMLKEHLDKKIVDFIPNPELITYVVDRAAAEGWTEDLIKAALMDQADSHAIKRVAVFDPLETLIDNQVKKTSTGSEVAQVVSLLLKVLHQTPPQNISPETFTQLDNDLKDLYREYARLSEGIATSKGN